MTEIKISGSGNEITVRLGNDAKIIVSEKGKTIAELNVYDEDILVFAAAIAGALEAKRKRDTTIPMQSIQPISFQPLIH